MEILFVFQIDKRLLPWEEATPNFSRRSETKKSLSAGSLESLRAKHKKPFQVSAKQYERSEAMPSLELRRGELSIAVRFPPDANVVLKSGNVDKTEMNQLCKCKNEFAKKQ